MIHRTRRFIALLLICLMPALVHAAQVQATLDRSEVHLGETVTLNLQLRGATGMNAPDLSALNRDFDVLQTSTSSSINIVNGRQSMQVTYGIALRPRHVGRLQIPALQVAGSTTQPLTVNVLAPEAASAANSGKAVFLEASVDPQRAYVGQQVVLTLRIYAAVNLTSGSLSDPQVDSADAQISVLGNDSDYQTQRYGRTYSVHERRYALIPQHAGVLKIGAAQFQGAMMFQGGPFDPNDPGNFFGTDSDVSAVGPALQLTVQPVPADWGAAAWLPARTLSLSLDGVPGATETLRVGQPFTVTMNLAATGVTFDALPVLSLPAIDGATAYPDQPVTGNRQSGNWTVGRREQSYAIVPNRAGALVIPATTIKWWNVLTDQPEVATIPAHTLHVLPAAGAAGSAPASGASAAPVSAPVPAAAASSVAPASRTSAPESAGRMRLKSWYWAALAAVLVLLTGGLWLLRRHRATGPITAAPAHHARRLRQAFFEALRHDDAPAQARALLAWARSERPALPNLGALASALEPAAQRDAIARLQRRIYSADADVDPQAGQALQRAFEPGLIWAGSVHDPDRDTLPPLYPFKLHD